jgi:hypothetical protein
MSELQPASLPTPGIDVTASPAWWLTKPAEIRAYLESLEGVEVEEIGKTAGGRPIIAAAWGQREMLPGATCDTPGAALGASDSSAYYGKGKRQRQVLMLAGAAHGTEFEGTIAAMNYMSIIATGKDLLGRRQDAMAEEGRKLRFIIIPFLNVDGRERAMEQKHFIGTGANGDLALMECTRNADGATVNLLCAVNKEESGDVSFVPLAELIKGNPYDLYTPPK